jgi:HPt (histidine-containing phosphotransfer) domain-containing protein
MVEELNGGETIKVLNLEVALELMDGDADLLKEVLQIFIDDVPRKINGLRNALDSADADAIRFEAHSLKGSSANIGAELIRELAFKIEQAGKEHQIGTAVELFEKLESELTRLKTRIATVIESL